jgi:hypothetical protein
MNHVEARLLIGAEPHTVPSELAEHLAGCAECTQFRREMIALDSNIRRALEQGPRVGATTPVIPIASARPARWRKLTSAWSGWALAASVALMSVLAVWALRPSDTLAHDIVRHVDHEAQSWSSKQPVPAASTNEILAKAGVTLDMSSDKVMYAQSCPFRGHRVPHLVVSTPQGPITVLILRYEKVKKRMAFHEDGMTGVISPAPHGSIAVLAQGDANIDAVAREVQQSVRWLP